MADIRFYVEGSDASEVARALEDHFEQEFGARPKRRSAPQPRPAPGQPERGDPVAVAALILSIPAAVLATMDLAERVQLKAKIERLVVFMREELKGRSGSVVLEVPSGRRLKIDQASAAEIMDAANAIQGQTGASRTQN